MAAVSKIDQAMERIDSLSGIVQAYSEETTRSVGEIKDSLHEIDKKVAVQCKHLEGIDTTLGKINGDVRQHGMDIGKIKTEHAARLQSCPQLHKIECHEAELNKYRGMKTLTVLAISGIGLILGILGFLMTHLL